jgi:Xaa-Pro aminopeptidase
VIVYGDFIVCDGPERRVGMPTNRVLRDGDLFILDFSVVLCGYRCDFTNTLCVGGQPTPAQRELFDSCLLALAAGEKQLRAGTPCRDVYEAVSQGFGTDAARFPHHAGHGLGLSHPEAPFIVKQAQEILLAGDVVTLEPGQYEAGIGGVRIEHNYRITESGYERLSDHLLSLN